VAGAVQDRPTPQDEEAAEEQPKSYSDVVARIDHILEG